MSKPRVAVIGYGYAGRCFHAYLVGLTDGLELYGVATSRAEAHRDIEDNLGVKTYDTFAEAIADDRVDLVVLATPNDLHAPHAIQAMEAGKHVVTDKPMCLSIAEADQMIATSQQYDRLLSVFHNRRWDGDYLGVCEAIANGKLGKPFLYELFWGQFGQPRGWRSEAAHGGGKFFDLGAHLVDQILQMVDAPLKQVYARFHSGAMLDLDVETHALAIYHFANGVEARVETSSLTHQPKPRWRVMGTEGALVKEGLDPQEQAMVAGAIDTAEETPENYAQLYTVDGVTILNSTKGRWRTYYENIAAAIAGDDELAVTAISARHTMVAIEAARLSAREGRVVTPDEIA